MRAYEGEALLYKKLYQEELDRRKKELQEKIIQTEATIHLVTCFQIALVFFLLSMLLVNILNF
jgi:hypothetical protein